jgi:hypothetical protein
LGRIGGYGREASSQRKKPRRPHRIERGGGHCLWREKGRISMLLLIIILLLVFGGGGGYYGYGRWGSRGGAGIGLGTILLILLIAYMLGVFH